MVNRRKASAYLGFDALKGLNEAILEEDVKVNDIKRPVLSNEQLEEMDLILLRCYRLKKEIIVKYLNRGKIEELIGIIDRINMIDKEVILIPKKKIAFAAILGLKEKNGWD